MDRQLVRGTKRRGRGINTHSNIQFCFWKSIPLQIPFWQTRGKHILTSPPTITSFLQFPFLCLLLIPFLSHIPLSPPTLHAILSIPPPFRFDVWCPIHFWPLSNPAWSSVSSHFFVTNNHSNLFLLFCYTHSTLSSVLSLHWPPTTLVILFFIMFHIGCPSHSCSPFHRWGCIARYSSTQCQPFLHTPIIPFPIFHPRIRLPSRHRPHSPSITYTIIPSLNSNSTIHSFFLRYSIHHSPLSYL